MKVIAWTCLPTRYGSSAKFREVPRILPRNPHNHACTPSQHAYAPVKLTASFFAELMEMISNTSAGAPLPPCLVDFQDIEPRLFLLYADVVYKTVESPYQTVHVFACRCAVQPVLPIRTEVSHVSGHCCIRTATSVLHLRIILLTCHISVSPLDIGFRLLHIWQDCVMTSSLLVPYRLKTIFETLLM